MIVRGRKVWQNDPMIPILTKHGGYRKTLAFAYACLIYHATETFCRRNDSFRNDPLGKTVGQMLGAVRSARQNLVEGSSRAGVSCCGVCLHESELE